MFRGPPVVLKRFYEDKLAQASYLIGCDETGEAVVIDPNRDIEQYLSAAAKERLKIAAVTETHIHADYLSGTRELAEKTRAQIYLSDEGAPDWSYDYPESANAMLIKHGDVIRVGRVRLDVIKTPGHTPEHITFVITDEAASSEPLGAITGDFVFVGDVGRPDLLESAAGFAGTMEPAARQLYESIQRFRKFPAHLVIWPGHGAGSACGKSLGSIPASSLGYEMSSNWAFRAKTADDFVREVLSGQPDPPRYFAMMKKLNKAGPPLLRGFKLPPQSAEAPRGAFLLDVRPSEEFAEHHSRGVINIENGRSFINWCGWLVPYTQDIFIIAGDSDGALKAVRDLAMIGLDNVAGWCPADTFYKDEPVSRIEQMRVREAEERLGELTLLDVRTNQEWNEGHVPGAVHIPLSQLQERAAEVPEGKPVAVMCGGGTRSAIAASVLDGMGYRVFDLAEGYSGYLEGRQPAAL